MTNVDNVFTIIPPHIRARTDLTLSQKMVAGTINGLTQKEGYCYASNNWIGKLIGISESMVSKHISKLAKKGLISLKVVKIKKEERTGMIGEKYGTIRHIYMYQIPEVENPLGINCEPPLGINYQYKEKKEKKEVGASASRGGTPRSAPPSSGSSEDYKKLTIINQLRILSGALGIHRDDLSDGSLMALYNRIKKSHGRSEVVPTAFEWLVGDIRKGNLPSTTPTLYQDFGDGLVTDILPKTFSEVESKMNKLLALLKKERPDRYQELTKGVSTKKYDF